jgi:hypothetical protein
VAEVTQDSLDGGRLHHRGHDPHTAVALGAVESIDEEHPPQQVGPRKPVGLENGDAVAVVDTVKMASWAGRGARGVDGTGSIGRLTRSNFGP